jgi:tRNA-Thr(GGU) m(6)t(6)A37 methyltransferase TsaA
MERPSGWQGDEVVYYAIGHVENEIDVPTTPEVIRAVGSTIVIDPVLAGALAGLEAGQRIVVVFALHLSEGFELLQHPRGDTSRPRRGLFALRTPRRPNPIGVSTVELVAIEGHVLHVRGLDAINGTPVLDIKPA